MSLLLRVASNPGAYLRQLKFYLAGWYFDKFMKVFKAEGCSFHVPDTFTNRVGRGYFALDLYEVDERKWIKQCLKEANVVLELGACLGVMSCIINKNIPNPENQVVVEANPEVIPYLTKNRDANGAKFHIENILLSEKNEMDFYIGKSVVESGTHKGGDDSRKVTVMCGTPSFLEKKYGIKFDTVVMDIEGAEFILIEEFKDFFSGINLLFMEEHPHIIGEENYNKYEATLREIGFNKVMHQPPISCWKK